MQTQHGSWKCCVRHEVLLFRDELVGWPKQAPTTPTTTRGNWGERCAARIKGCNAVCCLLPVEWDESAQRHVFSFHQRHETDWIYTQRQDRRVENIVFAVYHSHRLVHLVALLRTRSFANAIFARRSHTDATPKVFHAARASATATLYIILCQMCSI